jgi:hypothetical protein
MSASQDHGTKTIAWSSLYIQSIHNPPTRTFGFDQKVVHGPTNRRRKQEFAGIGIVKFNGLRAILGFLQKPGLAFKVSRKLSIMAVVRQKKTRNKCQETKTKKVRHHGRKIEQF